MKVVISQSMYFPWVGFLEQIRLADIFIHYDDVQFSRGGFSNRVQVKTAGQMVWMTAPLSNHRLGQNVDAVKLQPVETWRGRHLSLLEQSFETADYASDALSLAHAVLETGHETVAGLARASMLSLARYFELDRSTRFVDSRDLGIDGSGSERVLALVKAVNGTEYVTGHGARNYLDHDLLEAAGVTVSYMDYRRTPYPQSHGPFTPHVTGLDLVAHCGRSGQSVISSGTRSWKEFLHESP